MIEATQENIKKFCKYNPETGDFIRIARLSWKGNIIPCNFKPRSKTAYGYLSLNIFGRPYHIHRLIWLYMTGSFPKYDVDHINGDRVDNRWCNLRSVNRTQNLQNQGLRVDNTTGQTGVYLRKDTGKYSVYIDVDGVRKRLGNFINFDVAVAVRKQAEKEYNFHPNHGARPSWQK